MNSRLQARPALRLPVAPPRGETRPRASRWPIVAVLGLQVLLALGVASSKLPAYAAGQEICLRAGQVDPVDPLRGRYVALTYEIARHQNLLALPGWQDRFDASARTLYLSLAPDPADAPAWHATAVSDVKPEHGVVLAGRYDRDLTFGLEQYFVPDHDGADVQVAFWRGQRGFGPAFPLELARFHAMAQAKVDVDGHAVLIGMKLPRQEVFTR